MHRKILNIKKKKTLDPSLLLPPDTLQTDVEDNLINKPPANIFSWVFFYGIKNTINVLIDNSSIRRMIMNSWMYWKMVGWLDSIISASKQLNLLVTISQFWECFFQFIKYFFVFWWNGSRSLSGQFDREYSDPPSSVNIVLLWFILITTVILGIYLKILKGSYMFFLVILTYFKYMVLMKFQVSQKNITPKDNIKSAGLLPYFCLELFIQIPIPFIAFNGKMPFSFLWI